MLNGKQYLQICDMDIFEVHICFHSIVILLEVVEHEFSSVRCDPREVRGNWGVACWFSCGKTFTPMNCCKNKRIKSPLFWILCIYLCSWTSLKCFVPFFFLRSDANFPVFLISKGNLHSVDTPPKQLHYFPCESVMCYATNPGTFSDVATISLSVVTNSNSSSGFYCNNNKKIQPETDCLPIIAILYRDLTTFK